MILSKRPDILCFALEYVEKLITRTTVTLAKGGRAPIKAMSYICAQTRGRGKISTNQQRSHAGPLSAINSEYIGRYLGNYVLYMSVCCLQYSKVIAHRSRLHTGLDILQRSL